MYYKSTHKVIILSIRQNYTKKKKIYINIKYKKNITTVLKVRLDTRVNCKHEIASRSIISTHDPSEF